MQRHSRRAFYLQVAEKLRGEIGLTFNTSQTVCGTSLASIFLQPKIAKYMHHYSRKGAAHCFLNSTDMELAC